MDEWVRHGWVMGLDQIGWMIDSFPNLSQLGFFKHWSRVAAFHPNLLKELG